jgi:hypothetical protein
MASTVFNVPLSLDSGDGFLPLSQSVWVPGLVPAPKLTGVYREPSISPERGRSPRDDALYTKST